MKNKAILLMGALFALTLHNVMNGITLQEIKRQTEGNQAKLVIEDIIRSGGTLTPEKKQKIERGLVRVERLNPQIASELKQEAETKFGIILQTEKARLVEVRRYVARFKDSLVNTFDNTEGTPGQKWYAAYNFAQNNYEDYIYGDISPKYFNKIIEEIRKYPPTDVSVQSAEKIEIIKEYLDLMISQIDSLILKL